MAKDLGKERPRVRASPSQGHPADVQPQMCRAWRPCHGKTHSQALAAATPSAWQGLGQPRAQTGTAREGCFGAEGAGWDGLGKVERWFKAVAQGGSPREEEEGTGLC